MSDYPHRDATGEYSVDLNYWKEWHDTSFRGSGKEYVVLDTNQNIIGCVEYSSDCGFFCPIRTVDEGQCNYAYHFLDVTHWAYKEDLQHMDSIKTIKV